MNPLAIFLPGQRASSSTFFIGLVVLAVLDIARAWILQQDLGLEGFAAGALGIGSIILILLFVLFLHMNRRRDAGRGAGLAFLPVGVAGVVSLLVFFGTATFLSFGLMGELAAEQGQDLTTAMQDQAFVAQYQEWLAEDESRQAALALPIMIAGFLGFWVTIGLFAPWFGGMKPETE